MKTRVLEAIHVIFCKVLGVVQVGSILPKCLARRNNGLIAALH